jgi:hypothetical protein
LGFGSECHDLRGTPSQERGVDDRRENEREIATVHDGIKFASGR